MRFHVILLFALHFLFLYPNHVLSGSCQDKPVDVVTVIEITFRVFQSGYGSGMASNSS